MKLRPFLILLLLFLSTAFLGEAKSNFLASGDVRTLMDQLFEYHVDKKEMSPMILERALKIYLRQFDSSFTYLLQEEAFPYLHPTDKMLRKALSDYHKDRFALFFALNQIIQDSIYRARAWREVWEKNPQKLIAEAKMIKIERAKEESERAASSLMELKERHYRRFLEFLALHLREFSPQALIGKEEKIVALCEKQMATMENEYLGKNGYHQTMTPVEQEHQIILRTVKALAQSLDAHTAYYSPEEAYAMKVQLEKGMCGIGVVLREGIDGLIIQEMVTGGPAEKSGRIQRGDIIVEVDGKPIEGLSFHHVLDIMKGKEGTKAILGLLRTNHTSSEFIRVELTRAKMTLGDKRVDVSAEPYGDGFIGRITLYSFYEGEDGVSSEKDLKQAIDQLKSKGPLYGLILDMRDNSGGFLSQSVKVTGLFISSGVVVISKYSDGSMKYYRVVDGMKYYDGPLVVLISRGSASAAEIVAQALRDYGVAIVIGDEQTYGKGTIQHQTVTSDGSNSFFKVTIGRYYSVSGKSTQLDGVKADILVPSDLNYEQMGESYLEYPLPADHVSAAYQDGLEDIDPFARKWFQRYYIPTLQSKVHKWEGLIPILRLNSERRVEQNRNYQNFLRNVKERAHSQDPNSFGVNDLQMDEAVNIVKDMIFISELSPTQ